MVEWSEAEERRAYDRGYYKNVRRRRIIEYLGGSCWACGEAEQLEVDHINPEEKSFNISSRLSLTNNREEVDKCQLLCRDCHLEKTARENSGFTHGTHYGWLKAKCLCLECSAHKASWNEARNKDRRIEGGRGPYSKASEVACGDIRKYYRGCRCANCRAANAEKERQRRLDKR